MQEDLKFKGSDPGAVKYGNFINYYQFHPPENRIKLLPDNIWKADGSESCTCLDIGCNAGDLTFSLQSYLENNVNVTSSILGVDIDPVLIERANEQSQSAQVTFKCLDIMSKESEHVIKEYLKQMDKTKFDIIFCFSTTMWIHLNHGDDGLRNFLKFICSITNMLIIEPQPWKCYRNALKRFKGSNGIFPEYKVIKFRNDVEQHVEKMIQEMGMTKEWESTATEWGRKISGFNI